MAMQPGPPGPPPPPPAPGQRGGAFMTINRGPGPAPPLPPHVRPLGPPGGQFQPPVRQSIQSTRVSDITPRRPLDEDACRKRLTAYEAHTIRKIIPHDSKEKATWAKSEITREPLSQEDILRTVKKLNESRRPVQDKKAALMPFQQGQVNRLLDEIMSAENDNNFEWSIAQLDSKTFTNKKGQKETSTITVYVKRAPLKDLNAAGLFNTIERNKQQRLVDMNRPPPTREQQGDHGGDQHPHPAIINMGKVGKDKGGQFGGKVLKRPDKKFHGGSHHSSDSDSSSSDSDSEGSYSSSENTTLSTSSGRHSKRYSQKGRSRSRLPREHRKKYYVQESVLSPEPHHRESMPYPRYVPEVPRVIPTVVPGLDPVTAAYQAGKIDADAERFGFDRFPRRATIAEPTAIVSYGRPERIERVYSEPRYEYFDDREEDYLRREDQIRREERRRRQDAEDYMDRRGSDSRLEPRIIYTNPNPFAPASLPRRYAPSHSTRDGW